jgi:hypothetical protein
MKTRLRNLLLACGILSSLLYVVMNIVVPMYYKGYSSSYHTVSELSAVGAPTRALWIVLGSFYTLLVSAFGVGVVKAADGNRYLRVSGILLFIYGALGIVWFFAPMHSREVLAAGGGNISDTMHLILAAVTVVLMAASMSLTAAAMDKQFRIYTVITILVLLGFGILTGIGAGNVQHNLPTPWIGVWERINIGVFLLWVIVFALMLMRKRPKVLNNKNSIA